MSNFWVRYIADLYNAMPHALYDGLLALLCLGSVIIALFVGVKAGYKKVAGLLFVEYVFLIICSTVLFRTYLSDQGYNFTPFWSYYEMKHEGKELLLVGNILNIIVFVPVGFLFSVIYHRTKFRDVVFIGFAMSVSIEFLQFILKRGFAEVDDVIHNTTGCLIGYALYSFGRKGYKWFLKRNAEAV